MENINDEKLIVEFPLSWKFKKALLFIIVIVAMLMGCKQNKTGIHEEVRNIDLDISYKGKLSKFYDDIDYFLIKSSPNFPLINPYKTIVTDAHFLFLDIFQNFIFIYNKNGEISAIIKDLGEGPDQFRSIDDFQVKEESIWIKDAIGRKTLVYDFAGNLLDVKKNDLLLSDIFIGNGFELYYSHNDPEFDGRIIKNKNGKYEAYVSMETWMQKTLIKSLTGFISHPRTGTVSYLLPMSYQLVEFDPNGDLENMYRFDFGQYTFKPEQRELLTDFEERSRFLQSTSIVDNIFSIHPFGDGYMMYVMQQSGEKHFIWLDENKEPIAQYRELENDIDGLLLNIPPWTYSSTGTYFLFYPGKFLEAYNSSLIKGQIVQNSNLQNFVEKNMGELKDENFVLVRLSHGKN
ncbi:6-bladed beta-propeller [Cecembia calidifontis]|uniref:6-bladed beta-propeller protein n=1 Tax=Cecembia calidifontis TaxID=1187080 RepID=A0A4Q7P402_9BACT|nr:6-bladed beta-propeller [Cecembia calidifontis]RZS94584.1 6-bladed beta-propeller protein [Cecembia calidifontis]